MNYLQIKRHLYVFVVVAAGLLTAQVIGTVHVYLSDIDLYRSMLMVKNGGYLPVPNEHVWGSLQELGTAFRAGLFFTLSIGAGLTLAALFAAWTWDRLFRRSKAALFIYAGLWLVSVWGINSNGFSLMAAAYMVIIPLMVFPLVLFLMPARNDQEGRYHSIAFIVVPFLLLIAFLPLAKKSMFLDIRDTLLLSNSLGRKISEFYYDYTLNAAQAFKSLEQKTIRTCRMSLSANESHRVAIENIFLDHDYLVIHGEAPVDLTVTEKEDKFIFMDRGRVILTTTLRGFAENPSQLFQQFSEATDRFGPMRLVSFAGMLAGAPLCIYILVHGMLFFLMAIVMPPRKAALASAILCLLAGITAALPLYGIKTQTVNMNDLNAALNSKHLQERLAALRYIEANSLLTDEIIAESGDKLTSPYIAERYWFVRALGSSSSPEAGKALLAALDDPNTNVVCMAFYSLGRQKGKSAGLILRRLEKSAKWYEQWYGYRALRSLGWKQTGQ